MSDLGERLEHYASLAMPRYPNDLCSEAKREIERLRDLVAKREDLCGDLTKQLVKAHEALKECEIVFGLIEHPKFVDPHYGDRVQRLGDEIGYGALMSSASASWRKLLVVIGHAGGEFVAGPCQATVTKVLAQVREALTDDHQSAPVLSGSLNPYGSFCSRCGGKEPDCYICGKTAVTSAQGTKGK